MERPYGILIPPLQVPGHPVDPMLIKKSFEQPNTIILPFLSMSQRPDLFKILGKLTILNSSTALTHSPHRQHLGSYTVLTLLKTDFCINLVHSRVDVHLSVKTLLSKSVPLLISISYQFFLLE